MHCLVSYIQWTGAAFEGGHIIHGAANAMYLPKVIKFNAKDETAAKRYAEIADFIHLGGTTVEEKIDKLVAMLRKMNDDLNIPHCIKNYGEGGLPAEAGFVSEEEFLKKLPDMMHVQVQIQDSQVRKRWKNFLSVVIMTQKLIFKLV